MFTIKSLSDHIMSYQLTNKLKALNISAMSRLSLELSLLHIDLEVLLSCYGIC